MSRKLKIRWTCPHCGYKHKWKWEAIDYKGAEMIAPWMACGECGWEFLLKPSAPDKWHWPGGIWRRA